jgi:hypothetical protein
VRRNFAAGPYRFSDFALSHPAQSRTHHAETTMLRTTTAMAISIQFWTGTRPSTRNSSTSQSSKNAPGKCLFNGCFARDHSAGHFARSRSNGGSIKTATAIRANLASGTNLE